MNTPSRTRKWYIAVLVLASRPTESDQDRDPLIDLQYKLIRATDPESAHQRALELGKSEELSYENEQGELVQWTFEGLSDLQELLEEPADGSEVYSLMNHGSPKDFVIPKEELQAFQQA